VEVDVAGTGGVVPAGDSTTYLMPMMEVPGVGTVNVRPVLAAFGVPSTQEEQSPW